MYTLNRKLKLNDSGPAVYVLQETLRTWGYLQPRGLSPHYPIVRMLQFEEVRGYVASLPDARSGVYDEATARSVAKYQERYNLGPSGNLDEVTLEHMRRRRCGVPDLEGVTFFPSFSEAGRSLLSNPVCAWEDRALSWHVAEAPSGVDPTAFKAAYTEMLSKWAQLAQLTLSEGAIGSNLQAFRYNGDGPGGVYAYAFFPCSGRVSGDQYYDTNDAWSLASATPANKADLRTVVLHELGHALGLGHTGVAEAVMYPSIGFGEQKRDPTADDRAGIAALYP